jgi:hypothetical protein
MMKSLVIVAMATALSACASTDYNTYVRAQQQAFSEAVKAQKPLVEIEAEPGQDIRGLRAVRIYTPVQAPVVQQARPSEWAGVLGDGLKVVGTVLGIKYGVDAAVRLSDSAGRNAAAGYPYVQAPATPQANVTNTSTNTSFTSTETNSTQSIGGDGVLGSGVYGRLDATSAPTVVTQPPPVVVTQPDPTVVYQPPPVVVDPYVVVP